MNNNILAVALASLLVGGVAVAAFNSFRSNDNAQAGRAAPRPTGSRPGWRHCSRRCDPASNASNTPRWSTSSRSPRSKPLYATVIGSEPVRETSTTSTPREVCEDVVVQERAPERDGNVGGTVAGAVIGGLVGNQVGGGSGRKAATAAGAVAGGFIGNRVDTRHVGGQVTSRTERQCHTVHDELAVLARGRLQRDLPQSGRHHRHDAHRQQAGQPASVLGSEDKVVGYDVTYRYEGQEQTIRMDEKPGDRLPVIDGQVVTQTASAGADNDQG